MSAYMPRGNRVKVSKEVSGRYSVLVMSTLDYSVIERRTGFKRRQLAQEYAKSKSRELRAR